MPTPTYTPLATVTLGSSASSVTFSSIPATYRDLVLVFQSAITSGSVGIKMNFNSDTGSNYSTVRMYGSGSTTASDVNGDGTADIDVGYYGTSLSHTEIQIMDYSATDKHKIVLGRLTLTSTGYVTAEAARWANTSAITSIVLQPRSSTFVAGGTFNLYGIAS